MARERSRYEEWSYHNDSRDGMSLRGCFFVVLSGYSCRVIVCQSQQTTSTEQDDSSLSTNVRVGILIGFLMAGENCEERRVKSCAPKGTRSCS